MARFRLTADAQDDLRSIGNYILLDNPERAVSFLGELTDRFRVIAERPKSFPGRDHLGPGIRSSVYGRYLILFRIEHDCVRIIRVLHGARNVAKILRGQVP